MKFHFSNTARPIYHIRSLKQLIKYISLPFSRYLWIHQSKYHNFSNILFDIYDTDNYNWSQSGGPVPGADPEIFATGSPRPPEAIGAGGQGGLGFLKI